MLTQHISILTDFDITNTGVVRNFKKESLPLKTKNGVLFTEQHWLKARRQQSNWETLIQLISLRTQPINIRTVFVNKQWRLEFDIEYLDAYKKNDDPLWILKEDCTNVPMLSSLTEMKELYKFIITTGPDQNIWFSSYDI